MVTCISLRTRAGVLVCLRASALVLFSLLLLPLAFAALGDQNDNIIYAYTFDNTTISGATMLDVHNNNNCTIISSPPHFPGIRNDSQDLDGSADYYSCSINAQHQNQEARTILMWLYPDHIIGAGGTNGVIANYLPTQPYESIYAYTNGGYCSMAETIFIQYKNGTEWQDFCWDPTLNTGTWHFLVFAYNDTLDAYNLFINGTKYQNFEDYEQGSPVMNRPLIVGSDTLIGSRGSAPSIPFEGKIDEHTVYNVTLTPSEISEAWNSGAGKFYDYSGGAPPVPGNDPFVKIEVRDLYNSSVLSGINVTLSTGLSNLTNALGVAHFNSSGGVNFTTLDPAGLYFAGSGLNAAENSTTSINISGAFVSINSSNVLGNYLMNFSACSPEGCNYTGSSEVKLLLPPNKTTTVTIIGYDGNHTAAINDTNQTYINYSYGLTTTGQDISRYNISGLFQVNLTVNVSIGLTSTYLSNFTTNITGAVNDTEVFTSNFSTSHLLMAGDYTVLIDPVGYSVNTKNITIALRNYTPTVTVPVFALNSFYLNIYDELNRQLITDTLDIELISDLTSGNYSTSNGSIIFELLTPTDYTIRWRGNNWPERDYYQTLVNQNYYNLDLYSLSLGNASTLLITVVDTTGEPLEGAEVQLRRYFVYCNCYEIVEMAKTSFSGEAFFNIDAYDGHYKTAVTYGGRTILTDTPENYVPVESGVAITRTINFNTGSDYYESYAALPDIARNLVYNANTGAFSFSWADPSGLTSSGCFVVEYANRTRYEEIRTCQNGSNGNVVYTLPDKDNTTYRYYALIETNTNYSEYVAFAGYKDKDPAVDFGAAGYFLGGLLIIFFGLIGAVIGAIGGLVFTALAMILVIALGLLPLGWGLATGMVTLIAGLGIFLMRR